MWNWRFFREIDYGIFGKVLFFREIIVVVVRDDYVWWLDFAMIAWQRVCWVDWYSESENSVIFVAFLHF